MPYPISHIPYPVRVPDLSEKGYINAILAVSEALEEDRRSRIKHKASLLLLLLLIFTFDYPLMSSFFPT